MNEATRHAGNDHRPDEALNGKTGYLFWSGVIIATYVVAGWLSLLVPGPDAPITPIFLPAGVAIAAILVFGRRAFPAVFLAALLLSASIYLPANGLAPNWLAWSLFLQPLFVLGMAHVARRLAQSLIGWPQALDSGSSIVLFVAVIIPLSVLVAAAPSAAVITLLDTDPLWVTASDVLLWWQSHLLGSVIAAPLLLAFWGIPESVWQPRRVLIAIPMLAALALSFLVFRQVDVVLDTYQASGFRRDMESLSHQMERRLEAQVESLLALGSFVSLKNDLDQSRFRAFVEPMLNRLRARRTTASIPESPARSGRRSWNVPGQTVWKVSAFWIAHRDGRRGPPPSGPSITRFFTSNPREETGR